VTQPRACASGFKFVYNASVRFFGLIAGRNRTLFGDGALTITTKVATKAAASVFALGVISCGQHSNGAPRPAVRALGSYTYRASLGPYDEVGVFGISPDTVIVDSKSSMCIEDRQPRLYSQYRRFTCGGSGSIRSVHLSIDLERPSRSTWVAVQTVSEPHQSCIRDSVTAGGTTICLKHVTESREVERTVSGQLYVSPVKLE
jgi:hypothetical protein